MNIISFYYKNALLYNALGCAPAEGRGRLAATLWAGGTWHWTIESDIKYSLISLSSYLLFFVYIFCLFVVFVSRVLNLELELKLERIRAWVTGGCGSG